MMWWSNPDSSHAYRLSVFSCVVTLVAAIAGVIAYMNTSSTSLLSFGLENFIDLISSVIVLWRFFTPHPDGVNEDLPKHLLKREKRASVGISFVMIILAWALFIASIDHFERGVTEDYTDEMLLLSIPSIFLFGGMSIVKFRYARLLNSPALRKDAACSLFGAVLAFSVFVNSLIIESNPGAWWLDPLVAMLVGIACMIIGARTLFKNVKEGVPIFTLAWWVMEPATPNQGQEAVDKEAELVEKPLAEGGSVV
uniref:Cation efflux protein transmembrane domain-containing protein n=1 Tax=Leptocylindrus danicus TaxID=163516 RepID=A0A7S2LRC3_9STRA|mmetsp:Transcript_8192/g.12187  ORF Transcript_8192/g.12187 Transcript_8192/m.12187 type:complete len:253 (+) Transcript_8192:151-909(+)|eukprot:CAMPEP_0116004442 /NCGR_PEP_ID=MMETSP0321-20121206/603_1 /TAXON_ID=163516 /ORGANISM="Leptocylindrus danicus var. danicus, Strain B650" /LENGTH=252 /DNA_ID=CAMNT_0003472741 /DNA_START=135 /DNA_END=893 /DNA_ORIENTATION=-